MRLYPRIPDAESVKQYYMRMAEGKLPATEHYGSGRRLGGSNSRTGYTFSSTPKQPVVRLITPTAQAEQQARAQLGLRSKQPNKRKAPVKRSSNKTGIKKLTKGKITKRREHKKRLQSRKRR